MQRTMYRNGPGCRRILRRNTITATCVVLVGLAMFLLFQATGSDEIDLSTIDVDRITPELLKRQQETAEVLWMVETELGKIEPR